MIMWGISPEAVLLELHFGDRANLGKSEAQHSLGFANGLSGSRRGGLGLA